MVIATDESAYLTWDNGAGNTLAMQTVYRPLSCYGIRCLKC